MVDIEAEKREIEGQVKATFEAEDRKDLEEFSKFLADDVILQLPNAPEIHGLRAVREFYNQFLPILVSTKGGSGKIEVSSSGDMAYVSGYHLTTTKGPEGPIEDEGKYLAVEKKIDGVWKFAAIGISSDKPPT